MKHPSGKGWIGVDFDRTLAHYTDWATNGSSLGTPVPLMLERVKRWLASGQEVRIFTARASMDSDNREENIAAIKAWCLLHLGQELEVTAEKTYDMVELWDDRAISVMPNEGYANCDCSSLDPLTKTEELRMWRQRPKDDDE
jgi:hypothetical protein